LHNQQANAPLNKIIREQTERVNFAVTVEKEERMPGMQLAKQLTLMTPNGLFILFVRVLVSDGAATAPAAEFKLRVQRSRSINGVVNSPAAAATEALLLW